MKTKLAGFALTGLYVFIGLLAAITPGALASTTLIDVEFNSGSGGLPPTEIGYAAIGLTSTDYWNWYSDLTGGATGSVVSSGVLTNLKFVNGVGSGVGLAVTNAAGANANGASDFMYGGYLYPANGGNISLTITNLGAGLYDFYFYGHGNQNNQNGVFQLSVGGVSQGTEADTTNPNWISSVWQNGVQYVEFTNVSVGAGQVITVQVEPGASSYACLGGLQIESAGAITPVVSATSQSISIPENTSQGVTLSGNTSDGGTLGYTVVTQPTNGTLSGTAPNLTYTPTTGFSGSDSFTFDVNEGTNVSAAATVNITVLPVAPGMLIDVEFNSGSGGLPPTEIGYAAIGRTSTDYWNWYSDLTGGATGSVVSSGVLTNLKFVNGVGSGVGLAVTNAAGANANGASDFMYGGYLYPANGGNISLTITNLSAGLYDFYFYGHGNQNNQNGVFQLSVGGVSQGTEADTTNPNWISSVWQNGVQYVEFTNVIVAAGQVITVQVEPGASSYACLGGLQIDAVGAAPLVLTANSQSVTVAENGSVGVTLTGSTSDNGTLGYTVATQPTNGTLNGTAPNLTYKPSSNYTGADSFTFVVTEGTNTSAAGTVSIAVQSTSAAQLINVAFVSMTTSKVGFAATGLTSTDYWNAYPEAPGSVPRSSGVLTDLEFANGAVSGVGLAVTNAYGGANNGAADLMYENYIYPAGGGNISLTITNLSAGVYDFYLTFWR